MANMFSFMRRLSREPNIHPSGSMTANSPSGGQGPYLDGNMGAIHRAAVQGNVWRMKKILLFRSPSLNDRDKMKRFILKEEKEKRQKSDLLYEEEMEQLRNKEQHYTEEVEINPQLKTSVRTQEMK